MGEYTYTENATIIIFIIGLLMGASMVGITWGLNKGGGFSPSGFLQISQETGDDMCKNFVGNETAIARDWWDYNSGQGLIEKGGIVCELPSFDLTQNIVIKKNNE